MTRTIPPRPMRFRAAISLLAAAFAVTLASCDSPGDGPDAGVDRSLDFSGPDATLLNGDDILDAAFEVIAVGDDAHLDDIVIELSEAGAASPTESVTAAAGETTLRLEPGELPDGSYVVAVVRTFAATDDDDSADAPDDPDREDADELPEPEMLHEWAFEVDATPPEIAITSPNSAVVAGEPVTIAGTSEPGATIDVGGATTTVGQGGNFEVELDDVPEGTLTVVATDPAGNSSDDAVKLVTVPSRVEVDEVRTVHVSFCAWGSEGLREPVLQAIADGRINAVQLDLKDEAGEIGFASEVPLAQEIGATAPCRFDLREAVAELHDLGVPVIGRMVAFRDPLLMQWAWDNDRDMVLQTLDGQPAATRYGGFANFAHPDVIDYNLDVAEEAAAAGVDHILWDYIRRPGGNMDDFVIVGLETEADEAIVEFTRLADERLAPYGVQHGASVYGGSATRPWEVGQDIPAMSDHLDYVAPMLYPTHWNRDEYDLAEPWSEPYELIKRSLEDWREATDGRRARVVPWLEDSNWPLNSRFGVGDREEYVREQIRATYDSGIDEWMLWDSAVRYTDSAMIQPEAD